MSFWQNLIATTQEQNAIKDRAFEQGAGLLGITNQFATGMAGNSISADMAGMDSFYKSAGMLENARQNDNTIMHEMNKLQAENYYGALKSFADMMFGLEDKRWTSDWDSKLNELAIDNASFAENVQLMLNLGRGGR